MGWLSRPGAKARRFGPPPFAERKKPDERFSRRDQGAPHPRRRNGGRGWRSRGRGFARASLLSGAAESENARARMERGLLRVRFGESRRRRFARAAAA